MRPNRAQPGLFTNAGARRALEWLMVGAVLALIGLMAFRPVFAVDMFWLLALGREIAATGAIPQTDLFSAVHPDAPWVQFQWLWELLAFSTVDQLGLRGLRAAQAALLMAGYGTLYVLARRRGLGVARSWLLLSVALVLFVDRFRLRPDAMNLVLLVPLLPALSGEYRDRAWGPRGLGLCFVWAGLHGGGVLFPVAAAAALAIGDRLGGRIGARQASTRERRASLRMLLGCTLGAVISPTTLPGLRFFASVYGQMSAGSPEWSPSWTAFLERPHLVTALLAVAPWLIAAAYGLSLRQRAKSRGRASVDLGQVLVATGCLILSAAILRMAFLSLVPLWLILSPPSPDADATAVGTPTSAAGHGATTAPWHLFSLWPLALAAILLAATVHYAVLAPRGTFENALRMATTFDLEPDAFPEEAVGFMTDAGLQGTVMNGRAAGGPLIYYGYPNLRVLADSRHNLTPEQWQLTRGIERPVHQSMAVAQGYARYNLELALLQAPMVRVEPLSGDWQLLFRAGRQEVYQHRKGAHAVHNLAAARHYLRRAGESLPEDAEGETLARAATRAGAAAFVNHPWRRMQRKRIDALSARGTASERHRAQRVLARMQLDAGQLDQAASTLARLRSTPRTALYRAVLAFERGSAPDAIATQLRVALSAPDALAPDERQAAAALARTLARIARDGVDPNDGR